MSERSQAEAEARRPSRPHHTAVHHRRRVLAQAEVGCSDGRDREPHLPVLRVKLVSDHVNVMVLNRTTSIKSDERREIDFNWINSREKDCVA